MGMKTRIYWLVTRMHVVWYENNGANPPVFITSLHFQEKYDSIGQIYAADLDQDEDIDILGDLQSGRHSLMV